MPRKSHSSADSSLGSETGATACSRTSKHSSEIASKLRGCLATGEEGIARASTPIALRIVQLDQVQALLGPISKGPERDPLAACTVRKCQHVQLAEFIDSLEFCLASLGSSCLSGVFHKVLNSQKLDADCPWTRQIHPTAAYMNQSCIQFNICQ